MAITIIDGTLIALNGPRRGAYYYLRDPVFRTADGATQKLIGHVIAKGAVADVLKPQLSGRFYVVQALEHKGIYAVRPTEGALIADPPRGNERLMAVLAAINVTWVLAMLVLKNQLPLLGVGLLLLTGGVFIASRLIRLSALKQIADDDARH